VSATQTAHLMRNKWNCFFHASDTTHIIKLLGYKDEGEHYIVIKFYFIS
jgi:hypothetical protein